MENNKKMKLCYLIKTLMNECCNTIQIKNVSIEEVNDDRFINIHLKNDYIYKFNVTANSDMAIVSSVFENMARKL